MQTKQATIANGQSLSGAADVREGYVVEIVMPAAWTAAGLTFQLGDDETVLQDVYDAAGEYAIDAAVVGANRRIKIPPSKLLGGGYLKVRSGAAGAPVAQGAERVIGLKLRPIT
jgi:hypothetical protein